MKTIFFLTLIPDGTRMVVVKCPTYYPGDIRIMTQRNIPELEHLVDCVVFPTHKELRLGLEIRGSPSIFL